MNVWDRAERRPQSVPNRQAAPGTRPSLTNSHISSRATNPRPPSSEAACCVAVAPRGQSSASDVLGSSYWEALDELDDTATIGPRWSSGAVDLLPGSRGERRPGLRGQKVGVKQVEEHVWLLTFMHVP